MTTPQQFPVQNPPPPGAYATPESLFREFCVRDIGADVQYRFSYQAACVALFALAFLLKKDPTHVALYCELLEDFLLQREDGAFVAVQIKTRDKHQGPFKTSDKEMLSTLNRFGTYEGNRPNEFYRYIIATNAGFWRTTPTWQNLVHVQGTAVSSVGALSCELTPLIDAVKHAADTALEANCDLTVLGMVFGKLELYDGLPSFGSEKSVLCTQLSKYIDNRTMREVEYVVNDLVAFVKECSDRTREDWVGIEQVMAADTDAARREMRVASKVITRDALCARLQRALQIARMIEETQTKVTGGPFRKTRPLGQTFQYVEQETEQRTPSDAALTDAAKRAESEMRAAAEGEVEKQDFLRFDMPSVRSGTDQDVPGQEPRHKLGDVTVDRKKDTRTADD